MPPSYRNTTANNLSLLLPAYVYYAFFPRFLYSFRTIFHTDFSLHWQSFAPDCHQKNPKPFPSPLEIASPLPDNCLYRLQPPDSGITPRQATRQVPYKQALKNVSGRNIPATTHLPNVYSIRNPNWTLNIISLYFA